MTFQNRCFVEPAEGQAVLTGGSPRGQQVRLWRKEAHRGACKGLSILLPKVITEQVPAFTHGSSLPDLGKAAQPIQLESPKQIFQWSALRCGSPLPGTYSTETPPFSEKSGESSLSTGLTLLSCCPCEILLLGYEKRYAPER